MQPKKKMMNSNMSSQKKSCRECSAADMNKMMKKKRKMMK